MTQDWTRVNSTEIKTCTATVHEKTIIVESHVFRTGHVNVHSYICNLRLVPNTFSRSVIEVCNVMETLAGMYRDLCTQLDWDILWKVYIKAMNTKRGMSSTEIQV